MRDEILRLEHITKSINNSVVLNDVRLSLLEGELLGIIGLNRSGKTALMKIMAGLMPFEKGCIYFSGKKIKLNYPNKNIHYIGQESMLLSNMSVKDNIFLANKKKRQIIIDRLDESQKVKEWLDELSLDIDPDANAGSLSYENKIYVSIFKALINKCTIIILDGVCSVFSQNALEKLQDILLKLQKKGISIIYVNNKLDDIYNIMDRTIVIKDGKITWTLYKEEFLRSKIIKILADYEIKDDHEGKKIPSKKQVFEADRLTVNGLFQNISFRLRNGEVLGLAINEENIRTVLAESLFGLNKNVKGDIYIDGQLTKIKNPKAAIKAGLSFISGSSSNNELYPNFSLAENVIILHKKINRYGIIRPGVEKYFANVFLKKIDPAFSEKLMAQLSSIEKLKLIFQKWMVIKPKVAIVLDLTLGLDMVAEEKIYPLINEIARQGVAVILISSYLPELIKLSDKILLIKNGMVKTEILKDEALKLDTLKEEILTSFIIK